MTFPPRRQVGINQPMGLELTLFLGTFATLLAIINPFEVLPYISSCWKGKMRQHIVRIAWKSCVYALLLSLFFLIFGTLILRLFGVPLAMVRIVGGIILMKIGFELFSPSSIGRIVAAVAQRKAQILPLCPSRCR